MTPTITCEARQRRTPMTRNMHTLYTRDMSTPIKQPDVYYRERTTLAKAAVNPKTHIQVSSSLVSLNIKKYQA